MDRVALAVEPLELAALEIIEDGDAPGVLSKKPQRQMAPDEARPSRNQDVHAGINLRRRRPHSEAPPHNAAGWPISSNCSAALPPASSPAIPARSKTCAHTKGSDTPCPRAECEGSSSSRHLTRGASGR